MPVRRVADVEQRQQRLRELERLGADEGRHREDQQHRDNEDGHPPLHGAEVYSAIRRGPAAPRPGSCGRSAVEPRSGRAPGQPDREHAEQRGRKCRQDALVAQEPAEVRRVLQHGLGVAAAGLVVAHPTGQRLLHQLAGRAREGDGGADALGCERQAVPGRVADVQHAVGHRLTQTVRERPTLPGPRRAHRLALAQGLHAGLQRRLAVRGGAGAGVVAGGEVPGVAATGQVAPDVHVQPAHATDVGVGDVLLGAERQPLGLRVERAGRVEHPPPAGGVDQEPGRHALATRRGPARRRRGARRPRSGSRRRTSRPAARRRPGSRWCSRAPGARSGAAGRAPRRRRPPGSPRSSRRDPGSGRSRPAARRPTSRRGQLAAGRARPPGGRGRGRRRRRGRRTSRRRWPRRSDLPRRSAYDLTPFRDGGSGVPGRCCGWTEVESSRGSQG